MSVELILCVSNSRNFIRNFIRNFNQEIIQKLHYVAVIINILIAIIMYLCHYCVSNWIYTYVDLGCVYLERIHIFLHLLSFIYELEALNYSNNWISLIISNEKKQATINVFIYIDILNAGIIFVTLRVSFTYTSQNVCEYFKIKF